MKDSFSSTTDGQCEKLDPRPSAYIIGQSNSVMRDGFARSMQTSGPLRIQGIKAVGSSASMLANFFVSQLLDSAVDYCIFDLNVYDRYLVYMGYYKLEHMTRYIDSALVECRSLNIEPVFALIPSPEFNEQTLAVYSKQIQIALDRKAFYFDGLTWLTKTRQSSGTRIADVFADVSHLNPEYSVRFARAVSESIAALHVQRDVSHPPKVMSSQYFPVDVIPLEQFSIPELVSRASSSVIGLTLVKITVDQPLRVHTGNCRRICGLIVDTKSCMGKLVISGTCKIIKNLVFSEQAAALSFIARVVPLTGDVADVAGYVDLSIAHTRLPCTEATAGTKSETASAGAVHISHILVERKTRSFSSHLVALKDDAPEDLNLSTWID